MNPFAQNDTKQTPADPFANAFGGSIEKVLDLDSWSKGSGLSRLYPKLRQMIADSVDQERRIRGPVREQFFPQIRAGSDNSLPSCAGVYSLDE